MSYAKKNVRGQVSLPSGVAGLSDNAAGAPPCESGRRAEDLWGEQRGSSGACGARIICLPFTNGPWQGDLRASFWFFLFFQAFFFFLTEKMV